MLPKLFFGYFAAVIILLSVLIITRKNPVHSILMMLLLFFHIAGLYLLLNAEFLAAVQLILYAGAILVLFLFVIMMLNLKDEFITDRFVKGWPLGALLGGLIMLLIFFSVSKFVPGPLGPYTVEAIKAETHTRAIGRVLYTEYLFPFEIASLVLLVAIVGAIVLAKKRS